MNRRMLMVTAAMGLAASVAATADPPPATTVGAYDDCVIAFIDTRPSDVSNRIPDNLGGWIETRPCDDDTGVATIDTAKPIVGFMLIIR